VGFIALFGIATDDGVLMSSYLQQSLKKNRPASIEALKEAVIEGGARRIRACAMTTATTVIALLPVLTSTGRGADIMIPMAIPTMGGMLIDISSYFLVPVLVYWRESLKLKKDEKRNQT
jgi:Cu(I)/Ag(I) efflux system membrane protein CusA/SilA